MGLEAFDGKKAGEPLMATVTDHTTERTAVHPNRPVGIRSTPTAEAVPEQMTARYTRPGQLYPAFNSAQLEPARRCNPGADDVQRSIITLSRVLRGTRRRRLRQ